MKKTVITLLLVLPFVLIYFISFTGRILSTYTHISVERIAIVDDLGNEYKENDYIKIGLGEKFNLNIKIFPELATNKKIHISNSDKNVCSVDKDTYEVVGLSYGDSNLIITSSDRKFVQFIINISVSQDDIQDIELEDYLYNEQTDKYELQVVKGKSEYVEVTIVPSTVLFENRNLVWESSDINIATVNNGVIKGINFGTTTITVRSAHRPEIFKEIVVTVSLTSNKGVYFENDQPEMLYQVFTSEFDLKDITVINLPNTTFEDITYVLSAPVDEKQVDISELSSGKLKFLSTNVIVSLSLRVKGYEYDFDNIDIWFVGGVES